MSASRTTTHPGPPSKHQLALMIWIAVFPTLTVLNLTLGPVLAGAAPVLRTFVLATIAVPIVIYGLMPRLHLIRARLLSHRKGTRDLTAPGPPLWQSRIQRDDRPEHARRGAPCATVPRQSRRPAE